MGLLEKEVNHCKGCFSCWLNNPGQCVIKDDMADILSLAEGADILILATPLDVDNISSMLKVFMDRRIVGCILSMLYFLQVLVSCLKMQGTKFFYGFLLLSILIWMYMYG